MNKNLKDSAIIMDCRTDQVAIAKEDIASRTALKFDNTIINVKSLIKTGHRFAVRDIKKGEYVRQYGYPFGRSRGVKKGELISIQNLENILPKVSLKNFKKPKGTFYQKHLLDRTFQGYIRKNGRVGTRNYYLVMPTSMCASQTALQIVSDLEKDVRFLKRYPALDGIVAIPHAEGCGCDSSLSINRLMQVLEGYLLHPNIGGCLIVDLGCEQTNYAKLHPYLRNSIEKKIKPVDWITIEENGGINSTRKKAKGVILKRLKQVSNIKRKSCYLKDLIVGTECGASDSFSGITANPVIGNTVDKVISARGSAILSEIPEMVGTFEMLAPRFRSKEIAKKFCNIMDWYCDLAKKLGHTLEANLVPKNIEGGLINNYIKSLGAVLKGGTSVIEDVIDYAEPVKRRGLSIMQGPGGDPESVTGIVASGANIVCFSTGQGTPTGNAICPVIKISTNSHVFKKLRNDIDFDAGRLLIQNTDIDTLGDELLEEVIDVASGKLTAAEKLGQRQFQIWTAGKLPL